MPETYGIPEPEPTAYSRAGRLLNEVVAGQSVVRTVALYSLAGCLCLTPVAPLAILPLILLLASDLRMS
jgi:hypothetical protein